MNSKRFGAGIEPVAAAPTFVVVEVAGVSREAVEK